MECASGACVCVLDGLRLVDDNRTPRDFADVGIILDEQSIACEDDIALLRRLAKAACDMAAVAMVDIDAKTWREALQFMPPVRDERKRSDDEGWIVRL